MRPHPRTRPAAAALAALATLIALALALAGCNGDAPPPVVATTPRAGGLDVTFLVTADTHFGAEGLDETSGGWVDIERFHERIVDEMNTMAGRAWPAEVGGQVARPLGVLVAGDLTDGGRVEQWNRFNAFYGLTGEDGKLKLPVFETVGNHDGSQWSYVAGRVARRHGASHYSWDWGDLHVACMGGPDDAALKWLARDLAAVGRRRPVVLYFHYSILGPYSSGWWFGQGENRQRFAEAIGGFNVVAIFHGHFHGSGHYVWEGRDVYNVGSAKHGWKSFAVVHVTDDRLTVGLWNYAGGGWWWLHSKPINGAAAGRAGAVLRTYPLGGTRYRPLIPHPTEDRAR